MRKGGSLTAARERLGTTRLVGCVCIATITCRRAPPWPRIARGGPCGGWNGQMGVRSGSTTSPWIRFTAPPVLVRTELTKFAYACSGSRVSMSRSINTPKENIKNYLMMKFHATHLCSARSILICNAVHRSTCLHNLILALTMNGWPLECARFAKSNHAFSHGSFWDCKNWPL